MWFFRRRKSRAQRMMDWFSAMFVVARRWLKKVKS